MENYPKYDIDRSFGTIVHWAERALINRLQQNFEAGGFDITVEQWRVLVNLWNREGQSQRELAEVAHKDKTGITRILHGMEKRDLVVRIPDRVDQRNKLIYLTRKGREFQQALVHYTRKTLEEALQGVSAEDTEVCKAVLTRVIRNLTRSRHVEPSAQGSPALRAGPVGNAGAGSLCTEARGQKGPAAD